jgi:hypothetical protein
LILSAFCGGEEKSLVASTPAQAGADVLALQAVGLVAAEIDRLGSADAASARQLADNLLALLLSPGGRALLPHATDVIARVLARRPDRGAWVPAR